MQKAGREALVALISAPGGRRQDQLGDHNGEGPQRLGGFLISIDPYGRRLREILEERKLMNSVGLTPWRWERDEAGSGKG